MVNNEEEFILPTLMSIASTTFRFAERQRMKWRGVSHLFSMACSCSAGARSFGHAKWLLVDRDWCSKTLIGLFKLAFWRKTEDKTPSHFPSPLFGNTQTRCCLWKSCPSARRGVFILGPALNRQCAKHV